MYISNREKIILDLLMNQKNGVTIDYLSDKLDVSTRTVYRELSSLESTLAQYQIKLRKETAGYYITGNQLAINELEEEMHGSPEVLTTKKRQSLLIIKLLLADNETKMEALANDLGVSTGTIQLDLQSIEELFLDYNIEIHRKKARGIMASSSESSLRLIISGLIANELNEYNFFRLFDESLVLNRNKYKTSNNPFLELIDPKALELSFQVVKQYNKYQFEEVTDTQFQSLVLFLALTIMRIKEKQLITLDELRFPTEESGRKRSMALAKELLQSLQNKYIYETVAEQEIEFLAIQIEGLNVPLRNEFSEEYDLQMSYKVRELIRLVSRDTMIDFQHDENLFHDLLAHLSAAIHRNKAPMPESSNPLLDKIYQEYRELTHTVQDNIKNIFPENRFHSNEILYVVIHFASAYERSPKSQSLKVLVICSSGIGTAKILENRLKRNIPEITHIDISKISKLYQIEYDQYDMILSTIFLKGFEEEYKVVTPLLMEDEMRSIKRYSKQVVERKRQKRSAAEKFSIQQDSEATDFKDFYFKVTNINRILDNFDVKEINAQASLNDVLLKTCRSLTDKVITDPVVVAEKLEKRMRLSPIGLPKTGMALFHCIDKSIRFPYFGIFDLSEEYEILDMENNTLKLKRILLLLAPDPVADATQEVMGAISASIVESDFNLKMYDTGSKGLIQHYLSALFLEKMR